MTGTSRCRLTEIAVKHVLQPGYAYAQEFEIGLGLVLEAIEKLRDQPED